MSLKRGASGFYAFAVFDRPQCPLLKFSSTGFECFKAYQLFESVAIATVVWFSQLPLHISYFLPTGSQKGTASLDKWKFVSNMKTSLPCLLYVELILNSADLVIKP